MMADCRLSWYWRKIPRGWQFADAEPFERLHVIVVAVSIDTPQGTREIAGAPAVNLPGALFSAGLRH